MPAVLLYLGRSYHALNDYDRAVQSFRSFLLAVPDSPEGHFFLGRSFTALERHVQAIREIKRAIDIKPDYPAAVGLLGLNLLKVGKARAAAHYFEMALKLEPEQPKIFNAYLNALLTQAIRFYYRERFSEAGTILRFIEKHRPESLVVNLFLAGIYRELGDFPFALRHFERASNLTPQDPSLYLQKAVIYLDQGKASEAYHEMNQAMKLLGRNAGSLTNTAGLLRLMTLVLFQNKRYRQALDSGRRLLKLEFHDAEMHALLGECFRELGEYVKAKNHYIRALDKEKKLEYYYGLVAVLWQSEEYKELYEILNRILRRKPDDSFAAYYLAIVLPFLGKPYERTIPIIQDQIRRKGPDPGLMNALGDEYLRANLPELAEGWFKRTLAQVESRQPAIGVHHALSSLISIYQSMNNTKELNKTYAQFLKHYPEDRRIRKCYACSLFKKQLYKKSAAELLKIMPFERNDKFKRMLAVCYRNTEKYSEAIILFKEILRSQPSSEVTLRSLVYCFEKTRHRGAAIEIMEKAAKVMKDRPSILLPLGVLYVKDNKLEKGLKIFRHLISIRPNDWKAHKNMGFVYQQMGNHDFADKFLNRANSLKETYS